MFSPRAHSSLPRAPLPQGDRRSRIHTLQKNSMDEERYASETLTTQPRAQNLATSRSPILLPSMKFSMSNARCCRRRSSNLWRPHCSEISAWGEGWGAKEELREGIGKEVAMMSDSDAVGCLPVSELAEEDASSALGSTRVLFWKGSEARARLCTGIQAASQRVGFFTRRRILHNHA